MERKERERNHIDPEEIKINVSKTKYPKDKKEKLLIFATIFNDLLFENGISQEDFADAVNMGVTSISNYRNGKVLPKQENIDIIAEKLNVSSEYLIGKSNTKDYTYKQLNKMFGFNDDAINNLSSCFNKEYLNNMFSGNLDSVNYFLEKLKDYVDAKNNYNKASGTMNKAWYKNIVNEAKFYLENSLIDLIDENLK